MIDYQNQNEVLIENAIDDFIRSDRGVVKESSVRIMMNNSMRSFAGAYGSKSINNYKELCRHVDFAAIANVAGVLQHKNSYFTTDLDDANYHTRGLMKLFIGEESKRIDDSSIIRFNDSTFEIDRYDSSLHYDLYEKFGKHYESTSPALRKDDITTMIVNALLDIDFKISEFRKFATYRHSVSNEYHVIKDFNIHEFCYFISGTMRNIYDTRHTLTFDTSVISTKLTAALKSPRFFADETKSIIQFDDCYVEDGVFYHGLSRHSAPRFVVNRRVWSVVESGKPTRVVNDVNRLLEMYCRTKTSRRQLLSNLSSFLLNNKSLKTKFKPKLVVLSSYDYGYSRDFSSLAWIFRKSLTVNSDRYIEVEDLFDKGQQELRFACRSIALVTDDSWQTSLKANNIERLTKYMKGDSFVTVYSSRNEEICDSTACALMVTDSIDVVKKLKKMSDICLVIDQTSKYDFDTDFTKTLYSDEAAQYLLELLVLSHLDKIPSKSSLPSAKQAKTPNSAEQFVDDVGLISVINYPVRVVKQKYEQWCHDRDIEPLKQKFVDTLRREFKLVSTSVGRDKVAMSDLELKSNGFGDEAYTIRCWIHECDLINVKYKVRRNNSAHHLESIDIVDDAEKMSDALVSALIKDHVLQDTSEEEITLLVKLAFDLRDTWTMRETLALVIEKTRKMCDVTKVKFCDLQSYDKMQLTRLAECDPEFEKELRDPNCLLTRYRLKTD